MEVTFQRCFLAIDFGETAKHKLLEVINQLKADNPDLILKWTAAENLHLTLRYFGTLDQNKLETIQLFCQQKLADFPGFQLQGDAVTPFPPKSHPKVIGYIPRQTPVLVKLYDLLQTIELPQAHKDKHTFHPHVTLARLKRATDFIAPILTNEILPADRVSLCAEKVDGVYQRLASYSLVPGAGE